MRNLLTKKTTYTFDYPEALAFADKQNGVFWTFDEIDLEKDVHSILTDFTPAERHGVTTSLKLFTKYERIVGDEYWSGTVKPNFQHPDIGLMADAFCYFESNVHARFYNRINELLGLATEEFHQSWQYDPVLASRVGYLDAIAGSRDIPLSLAVFSMMEGCILYSSFAFLKHFQSNGKNKLSNLVAGINFSVRDENIHHEAGAWLFRTYMDENKLDKGWMKARVEQAAKALVEHEHRIVDLLFSHGDIEGINATAMKAFVNARANVCLNNLGFDSIFEETGDTISEWFYIGISTSVIHDFFAKVGNQYSRKWNEKGFTW
jgi:ribonucleotide reductase beta subunit family protein with ferritin-like domain